MIKNSSILKKIWIKFLYGNHWMPTILYLTMRYYVEIGEIPNLIKPLNYNEKINWLKMMDHNDKYFDLVDKYEVKDYVSKKIGSRYVVPTLAIWNDVDDIKLDILPDKFVLKCTHDSGSVVICTNKSSFDIEDAKTRLNKSFRQNHYWWGREWAYKNVKPRIIAEQYIEDYDGNTVDYKIWCFHGKPKVIEVIYDRFTEYKCQIFDINWNKINCVVGKEQDNSRIINKPECLNKLLELAEKLSCGFTFIRIDFYIINDKIYFGEMTFYPGSGIEKIEPEEFNIELGNWI